jgi:hypothetical protein
LDVGWALVGVVVIAVAAAAAFIFAGIARRRRRRAMPASALDKALAELDPKHEIQAPSSNAFARSRSRVNRR